MSNAWRGGWLAPSSSSCGAVLVLRLVSTAEDWRLQLAMGVWVSGLGELREEVWDSLLHLTTSTVSVLMRTDPDLAARGFALLAHTRCRRGFGIKSCLPILSRLCEIMIWRVIPMAERGALGRELTLLPRPCGRRVS